MARENTIMLVGEVSKAPTVFYNEVHQNFRMAFAVKTVRRNGRIDYPRVNVYGLTEQEAKEYFSKLKVGVFLMVRGMITTKLVPRKFKCEKCGVISEAESLITEVISYGKPVCLEGKYEAAQIAEFANNLSVIGTVCTDVIGRDSGSGVSLTQYQLAINRKYRVAEHEGVIKSDYPWIKSFGNQAEEDLKRLRKSSKVYISGALQTREMSKFLICEHCSSRMDYTESVAEIVPQDVEYLVNCVFEEQAGKDGEV